jgi:hypothetical protein
MDLSAIRKTTGKRGVLCINSYPCAFFSSIITIILTPKASIFIAVHSIVGYVYLENMAFPAYYSIIRPERVVKQINRHLIL